MPLRSVEAATREDAIAAAREQFGPSARIVGVRRVRSGGVLGFFASERFVAEVDPESGRKPEARPRARASTPAVETRAVDPVDEVAGLFAAEDEPPVPTYSRAGARTAPARSETPRAAAPRPAPRPASRVETPRPASRVETPRPASRVGTPRPASRVGTPRVAAEPVDAARARAGRQRFASEEATRTAASSVAEPASDHGDDADPSPSPFTLALARMMARDRDVRDAVRDVLGEAEPADGPLPPASSPAWGVTGIDDVRPPAARQPEPVAPQVVPQPSPAEPVVPAPLPAEPVLAASPEPVVPASPEPVVATSSEPVVPASSEPSTEAATAREEAIAAVLRAALAQRPSDEALSDILRGVLAGAAPDVPAPVAPAAATAEEPAAAGEVVPAEETDPAVLPEVVVVEPALAEIVDAPVARPFEDLAESVTSESVTVETVVMGAVRVNSVRTEVVTMTSPGLARTASDPAPLAADATAIMPPLSLLPPLPALGTPDQPLLRPRLGRPPVPPPTRRPAAPARPAALPAAPTAPGGTGTALATVTRLPFAVVAGGGSDSSTAPMGRVTALAPSPCAELIAALRALGLPSELLAGEFADDVATRGLYAALTRALSAGLPRAPRLPSGAGEVVFVVGPGVETLTAARTLATSVHLDPDRVLWATRGQLAGLAPRSSRVTTVDGAVERRDAAARAGTMTVVAVDAPLRADARWTAQMLEVWNPAAVWAVVDATRKPEDLHPWLAALQRVDALMVQDADLSADPAAVLALPLPVALLDGVPATPHRWASLLCERLETLEA